MVIEVAVRAFSFAEVAARSPKYALKALFGASTGLILGVEAKKFYICPNTLTGSNKMRKIRHLLVEIKRFRVQDPVTTDLGTVARGSSLVIRL